MEKGNWKFGEQVSKIFDTHVSQSVPLYEQIQHLITEISQFFIREGSLVYDIGTSTGTTVELLKKSINKQFYIAGIDNSPSMIKQAGEKLKGIEDVKLICSNIESYELKKGSSLIISNLTVQFLPCETRSEVINKFYKSLKEGGALIIVEKIYGATARHQDIFTQLYHDYKESRGLSPLEIRDKDKSLRSVLVPNSDEDNRKMLEEAGFKVDEFFKCLNFIGYLAIK